MTNREKRDCMALEKRLNDIYSDLLNSSKSRNLIAASVEAVQFALAVLRGYEGD